jgi:hypothetical protein
MRRHRKLFPEVADVRVNRTFQNMDVISPDFRDELVPRENSLVVLREKKQKAKLDR